MEMDERALPYEELRDALFQYEEEEFSSIVNKCLNEGLSSLALASGALRPLAKELFRRFQQNDIAFPEFFLMNEMIREAFNVLLPTIRSSAGSCENAEKVVIGVIEGDIHDIGKNIVKAALEIEGFRVIDLGNDVPLTKFVEAARETGARVIASSTLMTPTLIKMQELEGLLKASGLKGRVKTIIGGAATSEEFANRIGADAWAAEAIEGVNKIQELLRRGQQVH